jgi:hypothetical protein
MVSLKAFNHIDRLLLNVNLGRLQGALEKDFTLTAQRTVVNLFSLFIDDPLINIIKDPKDSSTRVYTLIK